MTSRYSPPPIIKAIETLLADTERVAARFVRTYRYDVGKEIRLQTMQVFHLANRACRDHEHVAYWVGELVWAIDDLRMQWQTAKRINATGSLAQFEHIIVQVDKVGRQAGGWKRELHPKAQNARGDARAQRVQKLSTRAASDAGANA